jgi:hypothetical protein
MSYVAYSVRVDSSQNEEAWKTLPSGVEIHLAKRSREDTSPSIKIDDDVDVFKHLGLDVVPTPPTLKTIVVPTPPTAEPAATSTTDDVDVFKHLGLDDVPSAPVETTKPAIATLATPTSAPAETLAIATLATPTSAPAETTKPAIATLATPTPTTATLATPTPIELRRDPSVHATDLSWANPRPTSSTAGSTATSPRPESIQRSTSTNQTHPMMVGASAQTARAYDAFLRDFDARCFHKEWDCLTWIRDAHRRRLKESFNRR